MKSLLFLLNLCLLSLVASSQNIGSTKTEQYKASFETKVKTIRENYFTTKAATVQSVVTDAPVEALTEEVSKKLDPTMSAYAAQLNKLNK